MSGSTEQAAKPGGGRSEHSIADRVAKLEHDLAVLQRRFETLRDG